MTQISNACCESNNDESSLLKISGPLEVCHFSWILLFPPLYHLAVHDPLDMCLAYNPELITLRSQDERDVRSEENGDDISDLYLSQAKAMKIPSVIKKRRPRAYRSHLWPALESKVLLPGEVLIL